MRVIARLDIKQGVLIKSIMFDGVKKLEIQEFLHKNIMIRALMR